MKILTKKWAEKREQVKMIYLLKEFDEQEITYEEIENRSRKDFYDNIEHVVALVKDCFKTNVAAELHYVSNKCYDLHLLLVDREYLNDKYFYFTLRGTNVTIINNYE